jgi:hypothetical protein
VDESNPLVFSPARRRPLFPSATSAGGARALELLRDFLVSEREKAMAEVEEEQRDIKRS